MKKLNILIASFFAFFACHQQCYAQQLNDAAANESLITVATPSVLSQNNSDGAAIVLVDEDFSGLTAGTEDEPDSQQLEDNLGWVNSGLKPYHDSCTKPWGGMGLTSAGGTIAVTNGFLNTPTGDYSGTLKMTCRVRLTKGQSITDFEGNEVEKVPLDIVLLRRSVFQDFKRVTVYLNEEWQTITFEADNGWFSDTMIQFFTPYDMTFLVDDVRIEHVITSIEYPQPKSAINVSDSSFIAGWEPTSTAEEYLLSVYTKQVNPVSDIEEGDFETINSKDGKMIDETNPGYPDGWNIDVTTHGTERHIFTVNGMFNSGRQSLCLDADGDFIESRVAKDPIQEAHFWVKVDDSLMPSGMQTKSNLSIQVNNGVQWFDLFYLSVEAARQEKNGVMIDCSPYMAMVNKVMQMRIVMNAEEADGCLVAVDDFGFNAPGEPIKNFVFEDKSFPASAECSSLVVVPDPNAEYFYYLKARNSMFTSEASNEIEVFDVHEPLALPATSVTADSYTANWKCGPKSDFFTIRQYLRYKAQTDVSDYVILDEDFSKVKSEAAPENPETGLLAEEYVSLDKYTKMPGWKAGSYAVADGMLGGIEAYSPYKIGSVILPVIDLSNNGGVCKVSIRAYGQKGDWLIIGGNSQITVGAVEFVETGFCEAEFMLEGCSKDEELEVYTQNYGTFLIDNIKITQSLKAGDEVTVLTKLQQTDNAEDRSINFSDVPFTKALDICYNVIAHRLYHGDADEIWRSHDSNMITVDNEDTGIADVVETQSSLISVTDGGIVVNAGVNESLRVYDFSGRMVKSVSLNEGRNFIPLSGGAYIIAVTGKGKAKVFVR